MHRRVGRTLGGLILLVSLTLASGARAQVDMNGPWGVQDSGSIFGFDVGTFVQTGGSLSATIWGDPWTGTITPASGIFTLTGPGLGCGASEIAGMAVVGGTSFSGMLTLHYLQFPGNCITIPSPIIGRRCGNGVVDAGEQCDDGNFADGDCCSSTCVPAPDASPCDDGFFCNGTDTCSGATCVNHSGDPCAGQDACHGCYEPTNECRSPGGTPCGPCHICDSSGGACVATPNFVCKGLAPAASLLTATNRTPNTMDKLKWKWQKGNPTTIAEFGTPTANDDYALCIFDNSASPQLLLAARAPAGSNWHSTGTGFSYSGGSSRVPDGLSSLTLKTGSTGNAKLAVKGEGALLPLPASATPWSLPLVVQLQSDAGTCWEARFSTAAKNDGVQFKAKSD